jgi:hypothetical protein
LATSVRLKPCGVVLNLIYFMSWLTHRFVNITFWRTPEAAESHAKMAHSTGLVQAILFEVVDRDNIGGSAYGG